MVTREQGQLNRELLNAADKGDAAAVAALLAQGADPKIALNDETTPLVRAVSSGNAECVKVLIPVSDIGAHKNAALFECIHKRNLELAKLILPHCDVFSRTNCWDSAVEPMDILPEDGWIAALAERMESTPDSQKPRNFQETMAELFFSAVLKGAPESIRATLPYVDVATATRGGKTALFQILGNSRSDISACLDLLLPGSDLTREGPAGINPLMRAALFGRDDSIRAILAHARAQGVDAGAQATDASGATALMLAASGDQPKSVQALLPVSDPAREDSNGYTAFDLAVMANRWRCADELAEHVSEGALNHALALCPTPDEMPRARALLESRSIKAELAAVSAAQAQASGDNFSDGKKPGRTPRAL